MIDSIRDPALKLLMQALQKAVEAEDAQAIQGLIAKLLLWSDEVELKTVLQSSVEAKALGDMMALTWHVLKRSAQAGVKNVLDDVRFIERALARQEKAAGVELMKPAPLSRPTDTKDSTHKILLIDDDALILKHFSYQLRESGFEVVTRRSTEDVDLLIAQENPSIIIMDLLETSDTLQGPAYMVTRQEDHTNHTPVIFMGERDDFDARLDCVRAGAHAFLAKPFDFKQLLDQVKQFTGDVNQDPYRVLAVDDDKLMLKIIRFNLEHAGIVVETTTNPKQAIDLMYDLRPDVLLTDLNMPECSGIELARMIRQLKTFVSIPIVFLTAETDPEHTANALLKGGDAYITKPVETTHLLDVVRSCAAKSREVRSMMFEDDLTGLYNPSAMRETLRREVIRADRANEPVTILLLDIDHLKRINDTYGHPAGDRLLKSFGNFLQARLRRTDWIGRGNGEQFAVIMPNTSAENAKKIIDTLRTAFADVKHQSDQGTFKVTFSGGVVSCVSGQDVEHIFHSVEMALLEAKQAGRNQLKVST